MGFVKNFTGGDKNESGNQQQGESQNQQQGQNEQGSSGGGGFLGSIGDKFNSAAGGGKESEKNEDYLDKGMCLTLLFEYPAPSALWLSSSALQVPSTLSTSYIEQHS